MNIDDFLTEARNMVSEYCAINCYSKCCKEGELRLWEDEVDLVTQGRREELEKNFHLFKLKDGTETYSLLLGGFYPCPSLIEDDRCILHDGDRGAKNCIKYPLFKNEQEKIVIVMKRCDAVKSGLLDNLFEKIQVMGFKIKKEKL